jgi:hypothetical protein
MLDLARILFGIVLPWSLGVALLGALPSRVRITSRPGEPAWTAGAGYLAGAFLLTVWMRALSWLGVRFSLLSISAPLAGLMLVLALVAWRSRREADVSTPGRSWLAAPFPIRAARVLWWMLVAWLIARAVLLGIEIGLRPLFPWDAWIQWATKARVWYALGRMAPFARADTWFAANGAVFFDASPEYPPTVPLLQVWSCIALGRWDDALMNWPWLATGIALTLAVYGGLRRLNLGPAPAIIAAACVATLPMVDVHVALAGYADLPMAAYHTVTVLALLAWTRVRRWRNALVTLLFAIACTQVKQPGFVWAATLLPGIVATWFPRDAVRIIGAGFAAVLLVLAVLAQTSPVIFNYRLHLDFDLAWSALGRAWFLLGNWHLLFYGVVVAAILAGRRLLDPQLLPVTGIVVAGLLFLGVVFGFTSASAWVLDQTTVNRATLHLAPLLVVYMVVAFSAFADAWNARAAGEAPAATHA